MSIDNLIIWDAYIYNFYDGVYNSFGVGLATNCILDFTNIYVGDRIDNGINPLISFNSDQPYDSDIICTNYMNSQMSKELSLYELLPRQLYNHYNRISCDSAY